MNWYGGESSLGTCHNCGGPVIDGGQSGAYCANGDCRYSYWGGKDPAQVKAERDERNRQWLAEHEGWWRISCGNAIRFHPTRDDAVKWARMMRDAQGLRVKWVERVIDGEMVEIDDDLTPEVTA